ncbi:MAG: hypothetical protein JSU85_14900 [Candidatus Zixiibacteriota bacterium]|nr:MAG: hypothetical protein JSU85_14900 [candidate division Zixibacteria bacterium]
MYCPKCRAEYVEGITECPGCGVSLVAELPTEEKHIGLRTLKVATILALIAICYNFAARTLSTFAQELFRIEEAAEFANIGFLLASIFPAFFFIMFFRDYASGSRLKLRCAAGWAIAASVIMILVNLKCTLAVFDIYVSPYIYEHVISSQIPDVIFPWIASLFILYFFVIFYKETVRWNMPALSKATLAAVIGSLIGAMHMTFVFWSYLFSADPKWFYKFSKTLIIVFVPIVTLSFILNLYFYIKFYKSLTHQRSV